MGVILRKNAVHSAIFLVFTLLAQAGLYLMLYAPFVAGVQIILYAGGIMVLFLFVIMLVNLSVAERRAIQSSNGSWERWWRCCSARWCCWCIATEQRDFPRALAVLPEATNTQDWA